MLFVLQTRIPDQQISTDGAVLLRELVAFATDGLHAPAVLCENTQENR